MEKEEFTTLLQKEGYVKETILKSHGLKLKLVQLSHGNIQVVF